MDRDGHRTTVDEIEFGKVFRFGRVLKAVGSSLQPARLGLGVLVIALIAIGGQVCDWVSASVPSAGLEAPAWDGDLSTATKRSLRRAATKWTDLDIGMDEDVDPATVLEAMRTRFATPGAVEADQMAGFIRNFEAVNSTRGRGPFEATVDWVGLNVGNIVEGTLQLSPVVVIDAALDIAWGTPRHLWRHGQWWFLLVMGVWTLLLIAVFGGGLCRMEAVHAAGGPRLGPMQALDFSFNRFVNFYGSLLVPLILAALLAAVLLVVGLLMNVPVLNVLVAVFYGISLLAGLSIALLLLGYLACGGMLVPAVAVENCDGADAMQRAYASMVSKPLHLILYIGMGLIGLGLGLLLVLVATNATLMLTSGLQGEWSWNTIFDNAGAAIEIDSSIDRPQTGQASWVSSAASWLVLFWESVVVFAVLGWVFSYLCAAWTRIYLLMRRACDGLEEDCIWYPGLIPGTLAPEKIDSSE